MPRVEDLTASGERILSAEPSARVDARLLLAHTLGVSLAQLPLIKTVSDSEAARFTELVRQRRTGIPLQHLTGIAGFRYETVQVGPGVFIPRPETEVVVGWAVDALRSTDAPLVVDLCTGSGAIALAIAHEIRAAKVWAVEVDPAAVKWTHRNLDAAAVTVVEGDMATALGELDGSVDLVISNPPYVPTSMAETLPPEVGHDPGQAVFAGPDGLDAVAVVARTAARLLRPGGVLVCEHDDTHAHTAPAVVESVGGFIDIEDHRDLTDRPRFVTARRSPQALGTQTVFSAT